MPTFGDVVKGLRKEKGLTQTDLADELTRISEDEVTRSAVSMWETNQRRPKFELLEAIADYFNVDMDYLLGKTDRRRTYHISSHDGRVTYDLSKEGIRELFAEDPAQHSRDEALLEVFRELPPSVQEIVIAQARGLVNAQKGQGVL